MVKILSPPLFWIFIGNEEYRNKKNDDNIVQRKNIIVIENFMIEEEI